MRIFQIVFILLLMSFVVTTPSFAKEGGSDKKEDNQIVETGWSKRCLNINEKKKGYCEIFQRLEMKDTSARVAEIAMGYPEEGKPARGVIALPLGLLLENGIGLQVDDGRPVVFNVRFCLSSGCISYVKFKDDIVAEMKKGKQLKLFFNSADGNNVSLVLNLKGFSKAINSLDK